jgi:hypothetical protein
MSERDEELGIDVEVVDESSAGQVEGSEGTPTHAERTQDVDERSDAPEAPPAPDKRNAPN